MWKCLQLEGVVPDPSALTVFSKRQAWVIKKSKIFDNFYFTMILL